MNDLRNAVLAAFDRLVQSEQIEKTIDKVLTASVTRIVEETLSSYSDFGKVLKEKVAASLALNGELELVSYNDLILKIVSRQVEHLTNDAIQTQVAERMKELLQPAPAEIKLSALIEAYKAECKNEVDAGCVCYGDEYEITAILEDSTTPGFKHLYLDDEPNKSRHQCEINCGIYKQEIYHLAFKNADLEKQLFVGPLHGFERMLFQMKAAKSKIVLDCDPSDLDLHYAGHID